MPEMGAIRELFTVSSEQRGSALHLRLTGELDTITSPVLERRLSGEERGGNAEIAVDLQDVTFMDVTGLRVFLRAAARATRSGKSFTIVKAPESIRRMLQITRTTHLLGSEQMTFSWDRQMVDASS